MLNIGLPLVASMASTTVMQFTDRIFLSTYSLDAIAAALPAGIANFLLMTFFWGVINYVSVFVAQYTGAGQSDMVGVSLWQGIIFALLGGAVLAGFWFPAEALFNAAGHSPEVARLETIYFRVLCLGAPLALLSVAMSSFYTGRGQTRPVMVTHLVGAFFNIPLDYILINGLFGLPELGIQGAGLATVACWGLNTLFFGFMVFTQKNDKLYGVWQKRGFYLPVFKRLMKYGLPGGVQFFLEITAATFFIFMTGRLGKLELAATNIAFSIESLAFLPMVGLHLAVTTLVGQSVGRSQVADGERSVTSTLHLVLAYQVCLALLFILAPEPLLAIFRPKGLSLSDYTPIMQMGVVILRFIAVYILCQGLSMVFCGAIKGAGDTRFVMWTLVAASTCAMIAPVYVAIHYFQAGLYTVWTLATIYMASLGTTFFFRYKTGIWKEMKVI